ncbi:hypothetical protein [Clavibacter sp. VKM Ac-2872]|uniref:hypothetical protein n=1 Tax=Clavibacter sp. VKM Ac-2872 TaxID=2783812 RepID=UPI00188C8A07|nr:hypothetical protein [Clavibacter sp. VKM Ac-2872]MBF4625518.1 hypothetical protein [Clavibacter sp. VKM Ac-2872]
MTGVPAELVIGNDFMIVRGGLVRTLDNANDALVWTRIHWRCEMHGAHVIVDEDGIAWWPASRETLAVETGLRQEQVRRCLERLVEGGFLETAKHHRNGNYDQTKSYRTVIEGTEPAGGSAEGTLPDRPMSGAVPPNVPSLKTLEEESAPKRAARLPKVFVITDEMRAWAAEATPLVDVDAKLGEWMDYWRGRGTPMKDWVATWRNGMRKQQDFAVRDGRTRQQPAPVPDVTAEVLREQRDAWLAEHGVTLEELEANKHDPAWRARIEGRAA